MAKFLQETLRESGLKANAHIVGSDAFKEFFRKVNIPYRWKECTAHFVIGSLDRRIPLCFGHRQCRPPL